MGKHFAWANTLHGQTQNANESFNSLIWERALKTRYHSLTKLKMCVHDAISYFNYGGQSVVDTLKFLYVDAGVYTTKAVVHPNMIRKYNTGYKRKSYVERETKGNLWIETEKSDSLKQKGVT